LCRRRNGKHLERRSRDPLTLEPCEMALPSRRNDARTTSRKRTLKAGIIAFNDRHSTLACSVRNISAVGARLLLEGSVSPPDTFLLSVALDGLEADCQVVWRKAGEIGVRFMSKPRDVTAGRTQVVEPLARPGSRSLRRNPKQ
jgi:hypothetical protein